MQKLLHSYNHENKVPSFINDIMAGYGFNKGFSDENDLVSGGFLKMGARHAKSNIEITAMNMKDLERQSIEYSGFSLEVVGMESPW